MSKVNRIGQKFRFNQNHWTVVDKIDGKFCWVLQHDSLRACFDSNGMTFLANGNTSHLCEEIIPIKLEKGKFYVGGGSVVCIVAEKNGVFYGVFPDNVVLLDTVTPNSSALKYREDGTSLGWQSNITREA